MWKKVVAILLCVLTLASLAACGKAEESETPSSSESSVPEEIHYPVNRLTGVEGLSEAAVGKRPVAVMINNLKYALPQYGIAQADILFETLVEGGITRMMAIYGDYTQIPDVCSTRSARFYYPITALSFDAVYVHWGEEGNFATSTIANLGVDRLSGAANPGNIFGRDAARRSAGYAYEHTGYLKGQMVPQVLADLGYRTDLKADAAETVFSFAPEDELVTPTTGKSDTFRLNFSTSYYSTFTYDEASNTYLKQHSGSPQMDGKTGTQLAFSNVLVLETNITNLTSILMDVEVVGSGSGWWFSNGSYQRIKWSKADERAPFKLTDQSGKELTINAGKSYLGMIRPDCTAITEKVVEPSSSSASATE
jgi:hypothetical protein